MAEDKKSFLLYADIIHTVRKMPKDKAGELFLTILSYVNDENPVVDDVIIDLVFEPIKQQLKRDLKKWEDFRKKQSERGSKGGRPKKDEIPENPEKPEKPTAFFENPKNPTLISESLNANANANVTVIKSKLSADEVFRLMRSSTSRKQISDRLIEKEVQAFVEKYENEKILNLASLVNKWAGNIKPDIQEKTMVL